MNIFPFHFTFPQLFPRVQLSISPHDTRQTIDLPNDGPVYQQIYASLFISNMKFYRKKNT